MLPNRQQLVSGWEPLPPLILAAWNTTPALAKIMRLTQHVEWAARYEALEPVDKFLRSMRQEDWLHVGE